MKILLVSKFFYLKGGAEASFFATARLLKNKGHKVIFFSMHHSRNFSSEYEKHFISNVDYENNGIKNKIVASLKLLYSLDSRTKIDRLIREERPDIVHLHNIYHQISPSIIYSIKKHNIPIVMTLHDYKMVCASYSMVTNGKICEACRGGKYYNCFLKRCVKNSTSKSLLNTIEMYLHHKMLHIYDLVDIFISPSLFLKNKLKEMGFKKYIFHLSNFLETEEFIPLYNWQENYIVSFGVLLKIKGLFTLIEAVKNVKKVFLKIIGEGPVKEELDRALQTIGCKNVQLLGYKSGEELKNEIRKSMFVVFPSECYETFGLTALEAFALGKPVIGSRIGGIPELVRDNETGLLFEPGNSSDLRDKIEFLMKHPSRIIEMGRDARNFVEKRFNTEKHYQKLMEIYKQAIASHKLQVSGRKP